MEMARSSPWIHHVEAFIDTSRSSDKQKAASLDAIAASVKKDLLTIEALVKEMELYLTTTDSVVRSRGVLLLAEILNRLISKSLDGDTVHSLIGFFTTKLVDWQALHGALIGCLALLRRTHNVGIVVGSDARILAHSCLHNLRMQSLELQERKLCFELLKCLLDGYPEIVSTLDDTLVLLICEAIDQEKDPQCLIIVFHLVELLGQSCLDPCGSVASSAGELFEILGSYFPIYFTHSNNNDSDIKREDLSRALMSAFCSTPFFEPYAIPMLLEKLSSSLPLAKLDSLKYLQNCLVHYGANRMATHAKAIWSSLKDVIFTFPPKPLFSFTSESERDEDLQENQIAEEALICLQTAILQLNNTDSELFINLVIEDEDLEMHFMSTIREKSYKGITEESQRKLSAVGSILCIAAKLSSDCCNRVFQRFFCRLMDILGISANSSSSCIANSITFSRRLNFGALYLCVELLGSCRELSLSAQESSSLSVLVQNAWCSLLQNYSSQLAYVLGMLVTTISSGLVDENVDVADVCCGVKGLQLLATFPGCFIQISKALYEDILTIFMSVITDSSEDIFLWKLTLKALGQIGSFIEKFLNSEKGISYMNIVIEKIVSLLKFDDSAMSLSLKLEAVSCVGTSGQVFMSRVIQGLEKAIFVSFLEAFVAGHLECAETLVCLLDCYSSQVLPWCRITGKFEEIAVQFALDIWNQMEDNLVINVFPKQGVLDATMMLMKLLVAGCTMEGQSLIVGKAYSTLSSTSLFPSKESLLSSSINSEGLKLTSDVVTPSCRDELLISLYASVLIALRPETPIPEIDVILKLFTIFILKGHVPAAQALGSIVNKWSVKINKTELSSSFTLETTLDIFFKMDLLSLCCRSPLKKGNYLNSEQQNFTKSCLNSNVVQSRLDGLAWIGKGFLMRGHEKMKEVVMLLLKCLLSNSDMKGMLLHEGASGNENAQDTHSVIARSAADAFHVLLTDSEVCLSKRFHAVIRPLYKQRFFSSMAPILLSSIKEADSSITRGALYRAFGHVISDTPLPALITEAKKLIPSLLDALSTLSLDPLNKDLIYSLLLVLAGILMDENGKEAIAEHSYSMVVHLVRLTSYPHMMLVRETAIQCLLAMSELPHARIYPLRPQVLQAVLRALGDPKRAVRLEAVRCRQAWASIASRSLHI